MYRTNDPVADWDRYCAEEERELKRRPKCDICGEHIVDDVYYDIDNEIVCPDCLKKHFEKSTENYVED